MYSPDFPLCHGPVVWLLISLFKDVWVGPDEWMVAGIRESFSIKNRG
jgi:hypothetical protein